jgi:hypothetical protein
LTGKSGSVGTRGGQPPWVTRPVSVPRPGFRPFAVFERDLIRERTHAGLAAARARGRNGGRPRALDATQASMAVTLMNDQQMSAKTADER